MAPTSAGPGNCHALHSGPLPVNQDSVLTAHIQDTSWLVQHKAEKKGISDPGDFLKPSSLRQRATVAARVIGILTPADQGLDLNSLFHL